MSFTDQKQRIATDKDCAARWDGLPNGKAFRCKLCGHKFVPGDKWRWVYGRGKTLNFMICEKCDVGSNEEIIERMIAMIKESKVRFWWLYTEIESWQESDRDRW